MKRLEKMNGPLLAATGTTLTAIRTALEAAGVQFLDDGDTAGGAGVALRD
ncbi:XRE family transcriptional regulator [Pelagibacterium sp. 26DY04]|nr:XRE family transcriptional regulator [Pelagibacterium sp. 26DY04]WMT88652.1 XRE family transcriptional regulator [Pelagibacterium sp. 26DY04]